jgi:hypothetical protein
MEFDEQYIEDYIRRKLADEDMRQADARYSAEPAFAQAVDEMRLLMELAHLSREERMRAQVADAQARHLAQRSRPRKMPLLLAAATFLLLAVVGGIWVLRPPLGKRIYADEFRMPSSYEQTLGTQAQAAYRKYDAGEYREALPLLRSIPVGDSAWDKAQFFIAASQLGADSSAAAITGFQGYLDRHIVGDRWYAEAQWYLALALLDVGRLPEAKTMLQALEKTALGSRRADARRVLERLE